MLPLTLAIPIRALILLVWLGSTSLAAKVFFVPGPPVRMRSGVDEFLTAWSEGGRVQAWAWSLPAQSSGATLSPGLRPNEARFTAPVVAEVTTFQVQVADREHPEDRAEVTLEVWPDLTLSPGPFVPGHPCELVAMRGSRRTVIQVCGILDEGGGSVQGAAPGPILWTPPRVELPTVVHIRIGDDLFETLEDFSIPVRPPVTLKALLNGVACGNLVSGNHCELRAERRLQVPLARPPDWQWTVVGAGGGSIHDHGDGRATYTAPGTSRAFRVYLRVTDRSQPGDSALLAMDVMPRIPGLGDYAQEVLIPSARGNGWMAPSPEMTPFAMTPEAIRALGPTQEWETRIPVAGLGYVEDPSLGDLDQKWIVALPGRLEVFSRTGTHLRTLARCRDGFVITALALRPRHSLPGNPRHLVLALTHVSEDARGMTCGPGQICSVNPDGGMQCLAGDPDPGELPGPPVHRDGQGLQARFRWVRGLAMAPDGDLYLSEGFGPDQPSGECIRRLATDGTVSTLAGDPDLAGVAARKVDGPGLAARFMQAGDLVLGPGGGALFLADLDAIRRVGLDGNVTTLAGTAGMSHGMFGLQILGHKLLLLDRHARVLRALNLETGALRTLVGDPGQGGVRMGPLGGCSPLLPPLVCASLGEAPRAFAVNPEGTGLVLTRAGLAKMELSFLGQMPRGAPAPSAQAGAKRKQAPAPDRGGGAPTDKRRREEGDPSGPQAAPAQPPKPGGPGQ